MTKTNLIAEPGERETSYRKIIVSEMVSLDSFFAGPNGEIDWHVVDEEFNQYAIDLLNTVDTILFGRVTYQLFESYWPAAAVNPSTSKSDLEIAHKINNMAKIVFSRTLERVEWKNARLFNEITPEVVVTMKRQPGKNMVIYGSGSIVSALINLGLIDEYRIIVNPVILGNGKPLFKGLKDKLNLRHLETKTFGSGNVLLSYQPVKKRSVKKEARRNHRSASTTGEMTKDGRIGYAFVNYLNMYYGIRDRERRGSCFMMPCPKLGFL